VEIEQPVFGGNYIRGKVRAQENGNWNGEVKFKLLFKSGGAIDYGQVTGFEGLSRPT
jgi:WW domain-binding protein 2